jgi:pimeloyl-ACP methyl ester carboxylesterase
VELFVTDDPPTRPDGEGTTFLLVHGWGGDSHTFSAHVEPLRARGRVIAPDLRGHGSSPTGSAACTVEIMAADLAQLLHAGGHQNTVAVGHSMGGQVVATLAVRHPDLVRSLVVVDPAYGADDAELRTAVPRSATYRAQGAQAAAAWVQGAFTDSSPDWLRTAVRRRMLATPDVVLADAFDAMYLDEGAWGGAPRAVEFLRELRCPVLALCSNPGAARFAETAHTVEASRTVHWPGTSHFLHLERPAAFVDLLVRWAQEV